MSVASPSVKWPNAPIGPKGIGGHSICPPLSLPVASTVLMSATVQPMRPVASDVRLREMMSAGRAGMPSMKSWPPAKALVQSFGTRLPNELSLVWQSMHTRLAR